MHNNLTELLINNQNLIFTGFSSVVFAFLIWSVKDSYQRHSNEVALLGKIEIIFVNNLGSLLINKSFFDEWSDAMKIPRLYNCSFRSYIFLEYSDFKIANHKLLNDLVKFNFSLNGLYSDLDLFFRGYHQTSLMLLPQDLVTEWQNLNINTLNQGEKFAISFEQAVDDAIECIAFVRAYAEQKGKTPYGLVRFILGRNLFSGISNESLEKHKKEIKEDLKKKKTENNVPNPLNTTG